MRHKIQHFRLPSSPSVLIFLYSFFLTICSVNSASAHKVTVFAWVEGDTVYTESKFSGGKKVKNAIVEVYNAGGIKLLEGKTNDLGEFSFRPPKRTQMKIVLLAGMGHRAEWTVYETEFEDDSIEQLSVKPGDRRTASNTAAVEKKTPEPEKPIRPETSSLSITDIQVAMENALDKKLTPVLHGLNDLRIHHRGPTLTDILSGIGYILGLMGIGAYVYYRKKQN